jgi:hypothetical protein
VLDLFGSLGLPDLETAAQAAAMARSAAGTVK